MQAWEERIMDKEEGAMLKLISLTGRMAAKGSSWEEIANLLEEDPVLIGKMYQAIKENPGCTESEIYNML